MNIQNMILELKAYGLTQTDIARMIGSSQALVSRWEAGDVPSSAEAALRLKDILGDFRVKHAA